MLDFIAHLPILKQFNKLAGGVFGFLEIYLIAFIVLYIAALIPVESIQTALHNSVLAEGIVKHTPHHFPRYKRTLDWCEQHNFSFPREVFLC